MTSGQHRVNQYRSPARHGLAGLLLCAAVVCGGCGYALTGQGSFLPDYIQTIGVPLFENTTTVFEIEQTLTQQVRSEFIGRGRYRVVAAETGVDAVLNGTIKMTREDAAAPPAGERSANARPG